MHHPKPRKGLRDIRSAASSTGVGASSSKVYMRLSALEVERQRCLSERRGALERARECDQRLEQLDERMAKLHGHIASELERTEHERGRGDAAPTNHPTRVVTRNDIRPASPTRITY
jgi:hypothetical protein